MGPVNPYLAAVGAAFDPSALAAQTFGVAPAQGTQQVMLGGPGGMPAPLPTPPPAPAGPPMPPPDPTLDPVGMVSRAPPGPSSSQAPPPAPAPPPQGPPPQGPEGPQYGLVPVGGGGVQTIAAHETEMRGPSLLRAQGARNQAVEDTVGRVAERGQDQAAIEYATALDQERGARAREQAAAQSVAERDEEMAQRQQDFDQSVKAMSKMSVDPDRFWASRSTGQKISGLIGIALGGLSQGMRGGPNAGLDIINQAIDRDIKAQEFAYGATRDTANAKQTAFGMAMQKYNSVDAARSMARAAALDAVIAQTQQMAALSKGTDAQNRADMALASLMDERAQQVAQGVLFAPARQVAAPRMFVDPTTGLTYTEAEAKGVAKEYRGYGFEQGKQQAGFLADVGKEIVKGQIAKNKDGQAMAVQLPNGDRIQARTEAEAQKLSDLATAVTNASQLVAKAKAIRSDPTWRASPSKRAELAQTQAELTFAVKDSKGLGALSGPDMDLARDGTADLFSMSPGVDAALDSFNARTTRALQNRVGTIPGVAPSAKGDMPGSFTPHGGK